MALMMRAMTALALLASAGPAIAGAVPVKTITFYNNSTLTLYPVVEAPQRFTPPGLDPVRDLWMQAQFKVQTPDLLTRLFQTTLLYRIFVNGTQGVPPRGSVTITVPFYTQLLAANDSNRGTVPDQYIDWWNGMRVHVFDRAETIAAAFNLTNPPPVPVVPFSGAAVPTCTGTGGSCIVTLKSSNVGFPRGLKFQLVEYTFADALNTLPPTITLTNVNYNISAVDNVYLPAAIGAHGNSEGSNTYLGSTETVPKFRSEITGFMDKGSNWPSLLPYYYNPAQPNIPLGEPPPGTKPYNTPNVPSTNLVYAEAFKVPPPAPPVMSADTIAGQGMLGKAGQGTLDLWNDCVALKQPGKTCDQIRTVSAFFVDDYKMCFPGGQLPATESLLREVYGWAQFPGCPVHLAAAPGYAMVIKTYCDLQYNYLDNTVPSEDWFNPYNRLVHQTLASNAYGFSIDDAVSYKNLPGDGIVITVGGTAGLEDPTQTPLPTATTYRKFCQGNG